MSSKSRRITVPALPARPGVTVKQLLIGLCFAALVISILWLRHSSSQNNSMSKELAATARFPAQVSSAANGPTRSSEAAQPDVQVPVGPKESEAPAPDRQKQITQMTSHKLSDQQKARLLTEFKRTLRPDG